MQSLASLGYFNAIWDLVSQTYVRRAGSTKTSAAYESCTVVKMWFHGETERINTSASGGWCLLLAACPSCFCSCPSCLLFLRGKERLSSCTIHVRVMTMGEERQFESGLKRLRGFNLTSCDLLAKAQGTT